MPPAHPPQWTAWRKCNLCRLAGSCGALGVASLVVLAVAGGGHIAWMMFIPFLIEIFLVIVALVFAFAWLVTALTSELNSVAGTSGGSDVFKWPQNFPRTEWLVDRCFIIAAATIAACLSLAWSGAAIWKGWNTLEIALVAASATAAAIVCTLWVEAVYWLVRNWRKTPTKHVRERHSDAY